MSRRIPLQPLRGSDPVLLEVQIQDLLRRPVAQLQPENVCDLIALGDLADPPAALRKGLEAFVERVRRETRDLPDGLSFAAFLGEFAALPPERIPATLRAIFAHEQVEYRKDRVLGAQLETWGETEPEPFPLGARSVRVQRAEAKPAPVEPLRKGVRSAADKPEKAPRSPRKAAEPKAPRPAPVVDIERNKWVERTCLERLAESPESGLMETVLIAGVKFRAKSNYPDLTPPEITAALRRLRDRERVRTSAGRWKLAGLAW